MDTLHYPEREPPCMSCRHFLVRMGSVFPYQCLLWEFSCASGQYPSRMVYTSTGKHCPYHLRRLYHPAEKKQPEAAGPKQNPDSEIDIII